MGIEKRDIDGGWPPKQLAIDLYRKRLLTYTYDIDSLPPSGFSARAMLESARYGLSHGHVPRFSPEKCQGRYILFDTSRRRQEGLVALPRNGWVSAAEHTPCCS